VCGCVKVFQVCGQPSLGTRSRRAASRRNLGSGRRRGEGRRRGNRRRRTTPSLLDLSNDDDDDDDDVISEGHDMRRMHVTESTASISVSSTSSPRISDSLWLNMTVNENQSLIVEERLSTLLMTTIPTSFTSTNLPLIKDSRQRRTRRPRRNRNRGSRRRKNQRTSAAAMSVTTEATYAGQHALWGMQPEHRSRDDGSVSRLERLIAEIRSKLTMNRELVTEMPRSLCSTLAADVTQRRCWNGTSYSRSVLSTRLTFVVGRCLSHCQKHVVLRIEASFLCQCSTLVLLPRNIICSGSPTQVLYCNCCQTVLL